MPTKREISKILNEISVFYELREENFFKIRAYQMAARALEVSDQELNKNTTVKDLKKIKGIGSSIAEQIKTLLDTGNLKFYEQLKASTPPGLLEMLKIPKLGPKKIKFLFEKLGIQCVSELEYACMENKLLNLPGYGAKTQENILKGIAFFNRYKEQFLYADVIGEAEKILEKISSLKYVKRSSIAGSLRRRKEIIKDIDILTSTDEPEKVMDFFTSLEEAEEIIARGETKSSIRLFSGVNVDIRTVSDFQFPYALHHFTGSKEHNTAMRSLAKKSDIKMNEYGLFRDEKIIECSNEAEIFAVFGMDYIEPELRENNGEIETALRQKLPRLITQEDLMGLFHFHTSKSDGLMSIEQSASELMKMGFKYGGIADHSKSAFYAGGLTEASIDSYLFEIENLNANLKDFKIFKGIECDILADGSLDYNNSILDKFDFVVIAVHSNFNMKTNQMTERIIKAMQNPYSTILAHPTGRLLLARDPYNVDVTAIIEAAAEFSVDLEINASPFRLDLDWRHCKYAKEKCVKFFINPDAHKIEGLCEYLFGVNVARKGWLEKQDIVNTFSTEEMESYLKNKKENKIKSLS